MTSKSNETEKNKARLEIEALVQSAKDAIKSAMKVADDNGLSFDAYVLPNMDLGATYYGTTALEEIRERWFEHEDDEVPVSELESFRKDSEAMSDGWYSSWYSY